MGNNAVIWLPKGQAISINEYLELKKFAESRMIILERFRHFDGQTDLIYDILRNLSELRDMFFPPTKQIRLMLDYDMDDLDYAETYGRISLNGNVFRDRERLAQDYDEGASRGWFVRGTDYRAVIPHEFGHFFHQLHQFNILKQVTKILQTNNWDEIRTFLTENLSEYSSSNQNGQEIIAEVFAEIFTKPSPSSFSDIFFTECLRINARSKFKKR